MNQKICGYDLDNQQKAIVEDESNHLLVVAVITELTECLEVLY